MGFYTFENILGGARMDWLEELNQKVKEGEISVEQAIKEIVKWMGFTPAQKERLSGSENYSRKFEWWKGKMLRMSDVSSLLKLCYWLKSQLHLFDNERAVLGALIRRLKEERRKLFLR